MRYEIDDQGWIDYDYTQEVTRGAAWLDEVAPGWDQRIDLTELNLADATTCVLGQAWMKDMFDQTTTDAINKHVQLMVREYGTSFEAVAKLVQRWYGYETVAGAAVLPELPEHMGFMAFEDEDEVENIDEFSEDELNDLPRHQEYDTLRRTWVLEINSRRSAQEVYDALKAVEQVTVGLYVHPRTPEVSRA